MIICLIPVIISVVPFFDFGIQQFARSIVPESIWMRLNDMKFVDRPFEATRIGQWKIALRLILEKPILGWGAAAFSIMYPLRTGFSHGHSLAYTTSVAHEFNDSKFSNRFNKLVKILNFPKISLTEDIDVASDLILKDRKHLDNNPKIIDKKDIIYLLKKIQQLTNE